MITRANDVEKSDTRANDIFAHKNHHHLKWKLEDKRVRDGGVGFAVRHT